MNLEEIWKWLKGKRNTFFCGGGNCLCFNCCSGCCRNYGGKIRYCKVFRSGVCTGKGRSEQSGGARAGERRKEARNADGGSDCRRAVPNHGTKQCDYRADGFLFSIQWKSISGGKLAKAGRTVSKHFAGFM